MPSKFKLPDNINLTFKTERLLIRPLEAQDKAFYISLYTDEKIMRHIAKPFSHDRAIKAFNATLKSNVKSLNKFPNMKTWTLVETKTNKNAGIVSLNWRDIYLHKANNKVIIYSENNEPEIGIMLAKHAHGKSIPVEAIYNLLKFGFHKLHIQKFHTFYHNKNFAVDRFVKKIGFESDGCSVENMSFLTYKFINLNTLIKTT